MIFKKTTGFEVVSYDSRNNKVTQILRMTQIGDDIICYQDELTKKNVQYSSNGKIAKVKEKTVYYWGDGRIGGIGDKIAKYKEQDNITIDYFAEYDERGKEKPGSRVEVVYEKFDSFINKGKVPPFAISPSSTSFPFWDWLESARKSMPSAAPTLSAHESKASLLIKL